MKRPIKFRGVDIDTGEFVYAELGQVSTEISDEYLAFITDDMYLVDADSIAQLVGYDKDGKEVYEGDIVTDFFGEEFTAEILDGVITSEGAVDFVGGVEVLKLKEAAS